MKIDKNREKTRSGNCKNNKKSWACPIPSASEARHMAVGLQRSQQDVDEPEREEQEEGEELGCPWAPELSARNARTPAVEQHQHAQQRHYGEEGDGEGQRARVHLECHSLCVPVNRSDGPRHPDAQEHVHGVAARHVPNGGVGVLVLDGSHFTRKSVCNKTVT